MAVGFEPPCASTKGHDWDQGYDFYGAEPRSLDEMVIPEEFCTRPGCYTIRGVWRDDDGLNVAVLYYGALSAASVINHIEKYGHPDDVKEAMKDK